MVPVRLVVEQTYQSAMALSRTSSRFFSVCANSRETFTTTSTSRVQGPLWENQLVMAIVYQSNRALDPQPSIDRMEEVFVLLTPDLDIWWSLRGQEAWLTQSRRTGVHELAIKVSFSRQR